MIPQACTLTRAADAQAGNRDRLLSDPAQGMFLLADGLGTRPGAAAASSAAVTATKQALERTPPRQRSGEATLRAALAEAQRRVRELPRTDPTLEGAGTTLSALVLTQDRGGAIHVGDSRILLFRRRRLRQLTSSHTVAAEVERLGLNQARGAHPLGHMLTRWLGSDPAPEPELLSFTLEQGDWLLLCSDGLPKLMDDRELVELLATHGDGSVMAACRRLEDLIGGRELHDDLSTILIRMESTRMTPGETDHE